MCHFKPFADIRLLLKIGFSIFFPSTFETGEWSVTSFLKSNQLLGDRPRSASSERVRAAGGGAAAAGEEGDHAGTVGGRAEEGGHLRGNGSSR